jgi:hypothetical protein
MEPIAESGFVANADYADEERGRGATSEVSLWWLERRYPSQFALRNVIRNEGTTGQPIGDKIDEYQLRRRRRWKISGEKMRQKLRRRLSRFRHLKVTLLVRDSHYVDALCI